LDADAIVDVFANRLLCKSLGGNWVCDSVGFAEERSKRTLREFIEKAMLEKRKFRKMFLAGNSVEKKTRSFLRKVARGERPSLGEI
jgi:hypothetical protein